MIEILIFAGKAFIVLLTFVLILIAIAMFIAMAAEQKKQKSTIEVEPLHHRFRDLALLLQNQILSKSELKKIAKDHKESLKKEEKDGAAKRRVYVVDFNGSIQAKEVENLREEITAVLQVAKPEDEVVVRLESPGGAVNGYGHAASQLLRVREKNIPLTVCVDEVAASGGYLMACVANKIVAAPFSIIGSIGVVAQVPNFHRILKKHDVDFKEYTAGEFKRTVTMFGEITPQGESKFKNQLETVHNHFKNWIRTHRAIVPLEQVATGEYWLATEAKGLFLVDELSTSDDYLLKEYLKNSAIYKVKHESKKSFIDRLTKSAAQAVSDSLSTWVAKTESQKFR